ncbi:unnamed protein product [Spirodela intermedia]|uniref:Uncharacterized protein n=1 Tax=Spirodela intermedia TaxID=51605 RepID=A0A7I8JKV7_SPIIN|nr:unnamed protein product [Spirodela intermedia]CAA6670816.1 unnamed protein product [Spirodela intermedia]
MFSDLILCKVETWPFYILREKNLSAQNCRKGKAIKFQIISESTRVAAPAETVRRQVFWRGTEVKQGNNWRDDPSFREPASGFTGKRNSEGVAAAESDRKWSTEPNVLAICAGVLLPASEREG